MPDPADLDLAHEAAPNPAWLRQLAETLKLEAAVLEGHMDTMAVRQAIAAGHARRALEEASYRLLRLADVLDATAVRT